MVLYEVENAFLFYDRQYDMITFKWFGFVNDEEYRKALMVAYHKTMELGVTRWLTDSRVGIIVSLDSQKWVINDFIPNFLSKSPLRRVAYLVSTDFLRQEYVNKVKKTFNQYQIEIFEDAEVAKKWLTKMYSKKEDIENELRRQANS
jgi:hypothetical protein